MRINKNQIDHIKTIEGQEIELFGNKLKIGKSKIKSFVIVKDLFCRFIVSDPNIDEDKFLELIQNELRQYNINLRKALCGQSKMIKFGSETFYTRSLMIADLSKKSHLDYKKKALEREGSTDVVYFSHKSIDAVNNFKEEE